MTDRSLLKHLVVGVLLAAATTAGCSGRQQGSAAPPKAAIPAPPAPASAPLKAAWIYSGPVSNAGWSFAHDQGRKAVEAEFGDRVRTSYVESVRPGPEAERVIRDLVAKGNRIIFATSVDYGEAMARVAKDHPDVYFEQATGDVSAPNLRVYDHRLYEAAYLAGVVAGGMSRTHVLGFVASYPIPEVLRNVNAFTLGAQSVNPDVRTRVVWLFTWYDPPRATQAAESLIRSGADVLLQNTDSPAVLVAAAKAGKYAFGWDSNMKAFAPDAHLGSCVLNWNRYYTKAIREVLEGRWKPETTRWGLEEGANDLVDLASFVPASVKEQAQHAREAVIAHPGIVFKGPLYDNTGKQVVPTDVVPDEQWLRTMSFLVKGVEGQVPPNR